MILHIDIETYSEADLTKTGVYRYAEDPSFEILLFGVAVDDNPVVVYDLKRREEIPDEIIVALQDNSITKWAFNAQFERVCLSRYLWDKGLLTRGTYLDPHGWRCDMVWAGYMGFPMNLKGAGSALQLDEQKMEEGKSLITYFCKPYRATSKNGYTNRNLPSHDPEKWELFKTYNKRDVEVEMAIASKLSAHPVPEKVWEEYWEDQIINDRGILIDIPMVENAINLDKVSKSHLKDEMQSLSGLKNPQSVIQMQEWLKENGVELDSLGKKEIEAELEGIPEPMRSVLLLRQQLAMSAVKKYQAMDTAACSDGRCRGMFRFYGANRSGRFCLAEGTPVLVKTEQNEILEKPIEDVLLSDLVYDGNEWVHHDGVVYSGKKDVITWDGITATAEHKVFITEDEKIPLGEAKKKALPIWRGQSQNRPEVVPSKAGHTRTYDILNAGPRNRFTANGRVVSNSGAIVQLQNLFRNSLPDLDSARALVKQGNYEALSLLYDSIPEVLAQCVRTAFIPAPGYKFIVADFSAIEARVLAWLAGEQWVLDVFASGGDIYCETASRMFGVPVVKHGINGELRQKGKQATLSCIAEGQPVLTNRGLVPIEEVTLDDKVWDGEEWVNHDGVVYKGEREVITYEGLTATEDHLVWVEGELFPMCFGDAARNGLHLLQTGERVTYSGTWKKSGIRKVYDILNAGPHHRFTVSGHLVHNCGYGGGVGALKAMGAIEAGMKEEELAPLVDAWRASNPNIVKLWYAVDRAAKTAIKEKTTINTHGLEFKYRGGMLYITLPSGRHLSYVRPRIGENRYGGESVTYMGTDFTKHWARIETFGGKLVENCLSEGTLVITNKGLVPIEEITSDHLIWDGEEFVGHDGLIYQGMKEVISVNGIYMTPDHKILTNKGWKKSAESNGFNWAPVPLPNGFKESRKHSSRKSSMAVPVHMWEGSCSSCRGSSREEIPCEIVRVHEVQADKRSTKDTRDVSSSGMGCVAQHEAEVSRPEASCLEKLWRTWHQGLRQVAGKFRELLGRHGNNMAERPRLGSHRQQRELLPGELQVDNKERELSQQKENGLYNDTVLETLSSKSVRTQWNKGINSVLSDGTPLACRVSVSSSGCKKPVYDILNCGSRHRFAVWNGKSALIVSNCVQAISRDILCSALEHLSTYRVVAHVHDECIVEVPPSTTVEEISSLMSIVPEWAPGLVLRADGYECPGYYLKD